MKILFLTHRLPYAPNRGDRIRSYYLLREMSRFAEVSLVSLVHDRHEAAMVPEVPFARHVTGLRVARVRNAANGLWRLWSQRPLTHSLLDAPGLRRTVAHIIEREKPDVAVAYCSGMARLAFEPCLARLPFVLDMVDVDSAKWARLAAATRGYRRWIYEREARTLRGFESRVVGRARTTFVVNERERDVLHALAPEGDVVAMANGIDLDAFAPAAEPHASSEVVFCGVMSYAPNVEGVTWFARDVWPRVRAARPDARFVIVGADPVREVRALAAADRSIEVTGAVASVQPYLWNAALAVAPLRMTQGLQNKVLEALAAGLPVITTPAVSAGLPVEARPGCVDAADAATFADAVMKWLKLSPTERRAYAARADLHALGWSIQFRRLEAILRHAAAPASADAHQMG